MGIAAFTLDQRHAVRHSQCLLNVKVPLFSVLAHASVIIDPVSHIGVLLDLRDQDSFPMAWIVPDSMKRTSPLCTGTALSTSKRVSSWILLANSSC